MTVRYANIERMAGFPQNYSPSKFFSKYSTAFLPSFYRDTAEELTSQKANFFKMWAWESENIRQELGIKETLGEIPHHETRESSYPGISYKMSEVYRSAFLRTLAWFHMAGDLDDRRFNELSAITVPIDLSLWEIKAQSQPKWWPRSTATISSKNEVDKIMQTTWSELRNLVDLNVSEQGQPARRVLAAQGSLSGDEQQNEGSISLRFKLLGFGYKVVGAKIADPETVSRLVSMSYWKPKLGTTKIFSVLDGFKDESMSYGPFSWISRACLEVTALVSRLETIPTCTWQWFRAYDRYLILSPFFRLTGNGVSTNEFSWSYHSDAKELARVYDWKSGILERHPRNSFPCHGNVVEVDPTWLSERLEAESLKLGYVLQVDLKLQNRSYEDAKDYKHVELIGVSRIISDSII